MLITKLNYEDAKDMPSFLASDGKKDLSLQCETKPCSFKKKKEKKSTF